jgi:hypothetical protein
MRPYHHVGLPCQQAKQGPWIITPAPVGTPTAGILSCDVSVLERHNCQYCDVPFDEFQGILLFVHSLDVLFEVVQTWPDLAFIGARRRCAEVRLRISDPNLVHALLMTVEIIDG